MYVFSERTFDVSNYSSALSSIAFSKCTKFLNNCLIEPSLIITKSCAKLKVIFSENYCILHERLIERAGRLIQSKSITMNVRSTGMNNANTVQETST